MTPWALAVTAARNPRATLSIVVGLAASLIGGLILLLVIVTSVVNGMLEMCKGAAEDAVLASGPTSSSSYVNSDPSENALADIPGNYLELYRSAASEYGIDWAVLAAVGKIETDHGRSTAAGVQSGQNFHGCCAGPMQFHNNYGKGGGTWGAVGYDANGDGKKDIYDPEDAIPSAAKYLVQGGAPGDYQSALFQYNQSQKYVNDVMAKADEYRAADENSAGGGEDPGSVPASLPPLVSVAHAQEERSPQTTTPDGSGGGRETTGDEDAPEQGAMAPVPERYMENGYQDDWGAERPGFTGGSHSGTDIFAPKGTPIYSIVDGEVIENAQNNDNGYSEVGGYNVFIEATETVGPIEEGDKLIYAHMQEPPAVKPGDEVKAGDRIGQVGATGYGPEVTRDEFDSHVHVGWYTDPESGRAQTAKGAMNPFPMLEWIRQQGGTATDDSASSSEELTGGGSVSLPAFCKPFQLAGFLSDVVEKARDLVTPSGGGPVRGSASGKEVVEEAKKYMGTNYILAGPAGCIPYEQMDCTCLTTTVFKAFGYTGANALSDFPQDLLNVGKPVEGEPKAGDVVVYEDPGDNTGGHVAIATGDGGVVHCSDPKRDCLYSPDYRKAGATPVAGIRRLVEEDSGGDSGKEEDSGGSEKIASKEEKP